MSDSMRKHYLDNLRSFCVLLLFPYHACMVYNQLESFFIHATFPVRPFSDFVVLCYPWFMPLMFALAGVSAYLSLNRRTPSVYLKERVLKLLIPFIFGILLLVPAQTYYAERYHNGYVDGYFAQYSLYFQNFTELTGYAGGFTPAHLWFILYLFVFSLITIPLFSHYLKRKKQFTFEKITMPKLLCLGFLPAVFAFVLNISGKSIGEYLTMFLLGFFVFSSDTVIDLCKKYRWPLFTTSIILLLTADLSFQAGIVSLDIFAFISLRFIMWICVLTAFGMGSAYLNFTNPFTRYIAQASFPVYVLHQTTLVAVAYYVLTTFDSPFLEMTLLLPTSIILTFCLYEIFRQVAPLRWMFGIKK